MRSPLEYVVALLRASSEKPKPQQIAGMLNALGQPLWNPPGPNGFSDKVDAWASSEGLATRIDVANLIAAATPGSDDPRRFARGILGPLAVGTYRPRDVPRRRSQAGPVACLSLPRIPEALTMSTLLTPRRTVLGSTGALFSWAFLPRARAGRRRRATRASS